MARLLRTGSIILCLLLLLSACRHEPEEATAEIFAMSTVMYVTAYGDGAEQAVAAAEAFIYRLEALLSVTRQGSDLWRLNHAAGEWISLSPETLEILSAALELAELTEGAFDPTIYPVLSLWGFTGETYRVPEKQQLEALLPLVDYRRIELDAEGGRARIPAGTALDFGGIAKGFLADRLAVLMEEHGISSALLDLGGNIQTIGLKPDGVHWRVGIRTPVPHSTSYLAALLADSRAVVTSGGYQRYFESDGEIYWHILDPATGKPAQSGLASVTVVGASGTRCDALSTAVFVMGEQAALELWRRQEDFELLLVREDGSLVITQGLEALFRPVNGGADQWEVARR